MRGLFIALSLCTASSCWAGGIEIWLYRPSFSIPDVVTQGQQETIGLVADPVVALKGVTQRFSAQGMRWEDGAFLLGDVSASLSAKEFASHKTVTLPVVNEKQTIVLFSYKDLQLNLKSRRKIQIEFPQEIPLRAQVIDGRVQFSVADDSLKKHLDAQMAQLLSESQFDALFELTLSKLPDLAREMGQKLIQMQKPQLLAQARQAVQQALGDAQLNQLFTSSLQVFPEDFPSELIEGTWTLRQLKREMKDAQGRSLSVTLWRLFSDPARAENSIYRYPAVPVDSRNVVSVILEADSFQQAVVHGFQRLGENLPLEKTESLAISKALGVELAEGATFQIPTVGEWAPRARAWNVEQENKRHFIDLVIHFKESKGDKHYAAGLIVELEGTGAVLRKFQPLDKEGPELEQEGWKAIQASVAQSLLRGLVNAQLIKAQNAAAKEIPLHFRTLGELGERNPGTDFPSRWAEGLAFDIQLP